MNTTCELHGIPAYFGVYMNKIWDMSTYDLKGMPLPRYDWGHEQHSIDEFSRVLPVFTWGWNQNKLPEDQEQFHQGRKRVRDPEK